MSKLELRAALIAIGSTTLIMGTPIVGLIVAGELGGIGGMLNYLAVMVCILVPACIWLPIYVVGRAGRWAAEKAARAHKN